MPRDAQVKSGLTKAAEIGGVVGDKAKEIGGQVRDAAVTDETVLGSRKLKAIAEVLTNPDSPVEAAAGGGGGDSTAEGGGEGGGGKLWGSRRIFKVWWSSNPKPHWKDHDPALKIML